MKRAFPIHSDHSLPSISLRHPSTYALGTHPDKDFPLERLARQLERLKDLFSPQEISAHYVINSFLQKTRHSKIPVHPGIDGAKMGVEAAVVIVVGVIVEYSAGKLNQISALNRERGAPFGKVEKIYSPNTGNSSSRSVGGIGIGLIQFVPIRALHGNGGWRFMAGVIIK